jgi:soluble lytic murein transglycosylase-like protein
MVLRRGVLAVVLALVVTFGWAGAAGACAWPFGPMHQFLYATAPYPAWQEAVIECESGWDTGATSWAGAMGVAQFMPATWRWGQQRYGIYGSPYDWRVAITMMNAFFADGYAWMWDCA